MSVNPDFSGLLIFTADVYRRQQVGGEDKRNRLNLPSRDEEFSHTLPCRFDTPRGGKRNEERSHDVVEVRGKLFLDQGADLSEKDVVTVRAPDGTVIVDRALVDEVEIEIDGIGEHHREAKLVSQREAR